MESHVTIAGRSFSLNREVVERALGGELPEPVRDHYVIVGSRRFPPKQAIRAVTGLDRADFTTHQARRILLRLGFVAARRSEPSQSPPVSEILAAPHGGRQAQALRPYIGKWVALATPTEILVAAETPQEVLAWLARHGRRADAGMFRVPGRVEEAQGMAPL